VTEPTPHGEPGGEPRSVPEGESSSDPNGEWWVDGPIFSTDHKGSNITTLRPGARLGRFTTSMTLRLSFTFVFWVELAFLAVPRIVDPIASPFSKDLGTHWWFYALVVVAVIAMVTFGPTFGFTRRAMKQYGQLGLPAVVAALVITEAFVVALLILLALDIHAIQTAPPSVEYWELPDLEILLIFLIIGAVGTLALLIALPFSIAFAVRTQRRVATIRDTGTRYAGTLEEIEFRHGRISTLSQFTVRVGFETPTGHRVLHAHMEAEPERVPLPGEPVLVRVATMPERGGGTRERILIEPDPDHPMRFDPDSAKYVVTADGGGG